MKSKVSDNFERIRGNFMKRFKETWTTFEEIFCQLRAGKMWVTFNKNLFFFWVNYGENFEVI